MNVRGPFSARLLDRHNDCTMRVQSSNGEINDVIPLSEDREQAGCVWGGNCVEYYIVDNQRIFAGDEATHRYEQVALSQKIARAVQRNRA